MSPNTRELTPRTTMDALRRQAKRWLKDIEAGDPEAVARFRDVHPGNAPPKLREVQHALAREFGFASWAALKQEVEDRARSHAERVELFLEKSVNRYSTDPRTGKWGNYETDSVQRGALAARLLARHPEIARESIHTAVVAHDLGAVRDFLARDRGLANDRAAFDGWTPLFRLAHARLPGVADALAIAEALLAAGAEHENRRGFTPLTGVIGGGEGAQSAHPQAEAFARVLIAGGADPMDGQALYNTSLGADDVMWLDFLWDAVAQRGESARVRVNPNLIGALLDYLLGNAVPHHPKRVAWLLAHGADANANNGY